MSLVANVIIPREAFPAQIEQMVELIGFTSSVARIKEMEEFLTETPLEKRASLTVSNVEVFGERLESYSFIISRRFAKDGETYVGGENGEICNVTEYLNLIREELQLLKDKS